jgi:chromosome segregation ATPase
LMKKQLDDAKAAAVTMASDYRAELGEVRVALQRAERDHANALLHQQREADKHASEGQRLEHELSELRREHEGRLAHMVAAKEELSHAHAEQTLAQQEEAARQRDELLRQKAQAEHDRHESEVAMIKKLEDEKRAATALMNDHRAELSKVQDALQRAVADQASSLLVHKREIDELKREHEGRMVRVEATEQETSRAHAEQLLAHQSDAATRREEYARLQQQAVQDQAEYETLLQQRLDDAKKMKEAMASDHSAELGVLQEALQRSEAEQKSVVVAHNRAMDGLREENEECMTQLIGAKDQMEQLKAVHARSDVTSIFVSSLRSVLTTMQRRRLQAFWCLWQRITSFDLVASHSRNDLAAIFLSLLRMVCRTMIRRRLEKIWSLWLRLTSQDVINHAVWSVEHEAHAAKESHVHQVATLSRVRLIAVRLALMAKGRAFRAFERNSLTAAAMKASETIIGATLRRAGLLTEE